jgi:hypothetical protein
MQDTAETWEGLLATLTDDELARYGEIARDQVGRELKHRWLQLALTFGAFGSGLWTTWGIILAGFRGSALLTLGLAAALGYWPYRKAKTRRLWKVHCDAVEAEQARRREAGA